MRGIESLGINACYADQIAMMLPYRFDFQHSSTHHLVGRRGHTAPRGGIASEECILVLQEFSTLCMLPNSYNYTLLLSFFHSFILSLFHSFILFSPSLHSPFRRSPRRDFFEVFSFLGH